VARLAAAAGWAVLAEPTSGVRCGQHDRSHVVAHYDVLLRCDPFAERQRPGLVLRVGDIPTSKPLRAWIAGTAQVVVDPDAVWNEPTRTAETIVHAHPARTCDALAAALEARGPDADPDWLASWRAGDALVSPALADLPEASEPKVVAALADALPDGALLWISSSMPIRHAESFFPQSGSTIRCLANRGANGIDGVVASAAGAARATGARAFLLIGEVALLHDIGGLLAARRAGIDLTVVCVNNGGGGIFDFLPVAEHADAAAYEEHIATPAAVDLATVASLAGLDHRPVVGAEQLPSALTAGPGLVELRTDRAESVRSTRAVSTRVAALLASASSGNRACSLTSVSASSSAGTESATIPQPA
jgi:2-succinyl-5-enolpyruvyl-6-hydroxy-3-cyclohexene-1-carboxylate synthase